MGFLQNNIQLVRPSSIYVERVWSRVELLPCFKFTGKMVKINEFTGKIGKVGKR
jgi:hypothetical protein